MKVRRRRSPRLKELSVTKLIPNMLTTFALCAGVSSIQFAIQGNWRAAVVLVAVAALFDTLDGSVARLLNAGSDFGAELDSLADLVSFGVAPGFLIYLWSMQHGGSIGSALVVVYCVCCALRLARFNTHLDDADPPPWASRFFTGVPAPAAAGIVLLPMMLSFVLGSPVLSSVWVNGAFLLGVSFLMISRVPTFSVKRLRIPQKRVLPILVGIVVLTTFMITRPWATISLVVLGYIASLPLSVMTYYRYKRQAPASPSDAEDDDRPEDIDDGTNDRPEDGPEESADGSPGPAPVIGRIARGE